MAGFVVGHFGESQRKCSIIKKRERNGYEVQLPLDTDNYPYYKWTDFYEYYSAICAE